MAEAATLAGGASIAGLGLGFGSDLMKAEAAGAEGYKSIAQGEAAYAQGQQARMRGEAALAQSKATQASDEFQAGRAERAARFGKLQAELTDTQFRDELNNTLQNIEVIRAAAHIDPMSPTTAAIESRERELSERQRTAAGITARQQIAEDEESARFLHEAGKQAVLMGEYEKSIGDYGARVGEYGRAVGQYGAELADYNKTVGEVSAFAKLFGGVAKGYG